MNPLSDSCAKVDELLLDYAYGELDGAPLQEVERHLEGCARCREQLEGMGSVRTAMAALPQEPAPEQGTESLLDYARRAAERRPVARRTWRWLAAAVPVGGLVALVFVAVSQVGGPSAMLAPSAAVLAEPVPAQRAAVEPAPTFADSPPEPSVAAAAEAPAPAAPTAAAEGGAAMEAKEAPRAAKKKAPPPAARLSFGAPVAADRAPAARADAEREAAPAADDGSAKLDSARAREEAPAAFAQPPPAAAPSPAPAPGSVARQQAVAGGRAAAPERKPAAAPRKAEAESDGAQAVLDAVAARKRAGDWSGALRFCEQFLSTYPGHAEVPGVLFDRAELLDRLGRPEEARRVRQELLRDHPRSPAAAAAREALR